MLLIAGGWKCSGAALFIPYYVIYYTDRYILYRIVLLCDVLFMYGGRRIFM